MKIRALATTLLLALGLAACGGSSPPRTVTVTQTVSGPATTTTTTTTVSPTNTSTSTTTSSSTTAAASTTTTASSTQTTRTETAPAFVGTNPNSGASLGHDLSAAVGLLARKDYTPVALASYHSRDTLRVLIGARSGGGERAFFFDGTIYLGTDASTPSAHIAFVRQNDTEVTLAYTLAGGRVAHVTFALDMGQLSPTGPLPPAAARG